MLLKFNGFSNPYCSANHFMYREETPISACSRIQEGNIPSSDMRAIMWFIIRGPASGIAVKELPIHSEMLLFASNLVLNNTAVTEYKRRMGYLE
jgi:hypothetical protein